ncbi:hypothetical protein GGI07_001579 [Coemansia sp. Benny D115]|nr:hypothetical protein GGI07_001579 [Coemansia sp. Benny D115]
MSSSRGGSGLTQREMKPTDISPGEAFDPLSEDFKPDSTRARFEELTNTYRSTHDSRGHALGMLDGAADKKESLLHLLSMLKNGEIPPTAQITSFINRLNFDKMRENTVTFQGKKVIDNLENSTNAGVRAFEQINGDENAQRITQSLDNVRKKTLEDRKKMSSKGRKGMDSSKSVAADVGKDFLALASGVGTSATFRKALTDMSNLISATINKRDLNAGDSEPLLDRVRDLVIEVRQSAKVKNALSSLGSLYTRVYNGSSKAARDARDKAEGHPAMEDLEVARDHSKDMFSRLGNGYDLDPLLSALGALAFLYRDNENVAQLVADVKEFGNWTMDVDEDKLTSDEFKSRGQNIIDTARHVLTEKDTANIDMVSAETKNYLEAVQTNPTLVEYKDAITGLVHSVAGDNLDSEERRELYRALQQELVTNLPIMMQNIRYVPLPRVAGQNRDIEFAADNIVLDLKHFVPEHMSLDMRSEIYPRAGMLKDKNAMHSQKGFKSEQFFYLTITGINCVAKRVSYYIKKKKGLPRLAETGVADLVVGGRGMDFVIRTRRLHTSEKPRVSRDGKTTSKKSGIKTSSKDGKADDSNMRPDRKLEIVDVKVKVHDLDVRLRHSKHNISSKLAVMLMEPVARKLIARTMAKVITENLITGDQLLAKHSNAAHVAIVGQGKKAMLSAKSAAQKSTDKIRRMSSSNKNKSAEDMAEDVKDKATDAKDKAKSKIKDKKDQIDGEARTAVDSTKDNIANKHAQQKSQRRDSLVQQENEVDHTTA